MAGTYPTSQAASRWASRWNPLSVELCLRPLFGLAWDCAVARQSPSRLMSIMRASLSGLTISHLCLSALPRATKEVPTTAQTALRRGMTSSDQASRSEVSDALSMPSLRVCAPTPPGFSQCGLCGASAQDLDLRSCVRLISAGSGASLSALSSPASASLRSVVAAVGFAACTGSCAARTGHP